jgi:CubicO group peptidase (beta-lactamase class C family)
MSKLDAILQRHVAHGDDTTDTLLGATFTVLNRAGETIYTGSAGRTDFPVDSSPYSPQTVTWIASMTKLLTATSLLQLVSANKITLDEDLRPRLPRLAQLQILTGFDGDKPLLQDNTHPITLRQLLTHTSGLIYDLAEPEVMKWSASANRASNCLTWDIDGFAAPLLYPPGQGWRYGTSTDWAGILLEHITGQTLGEYMGEHIFTPLEMADTTFRPHTRPDLLARRAAMTFRPTVEGGEPLVPIPYPTPERHEVESGGSGLYSTLADYTKFIAAIVRGDERILDTETRELLFAPQLTRVQRESMRAAVEEAQDVYAIEFPPGLGIDFGFGGMVNTEDLPGRRRKGSVMWSGMANGHWVSLSSFLSQVRMMD